MLLLFAASALADERCRLQAAYEDMDEKPISYWVFSPVLGRCIMTFPGRIMGSGAFGNSGTQGRGSGGSEGLGMGGSRGRGIGDAGSGTHPGLKGPAGLSKEKPSDAAESGAAPSRPQVPSHQAPVMAKPRMSSTSELQIMFHGAPKTFDAKPQGPTSPEAPKPKVTEEAQESNEPQKAPDLS